MSSTRSSKYTVSFTGLKSDFSESCKRAKFWISDKLDSKKSPSTPSEATPLLTKPKTEPLAEFQKDVSKQCAKAKTWFSEKMNSETANKVKSGLGRAEESVKSNLSEFKTSVTSQCIKAKDWVSEKMESESALRAKGVAQGAVKAAVGVYPILDLLLSLIPATAPYYLGFKIAKYIITSIAFAISAYSAYQRGVSEKSFNTILEEKLIEVQKMEFSSEEMRKKEDELLRKDGFVSANSPCIQIEQKEQQAIVASVPEQKSTFTLFAESKPAVFTRALINGALSAATLYYVCDLVSTFIPVFEAFEIIKKVLVWTAFTWGTLEAYDHITKTMDSLAKLLHLESQIAKAEVTLEKVEKSLGSPEQLKEMAEYGALATNGAMQVIIDNPSEIKTTPPVEKSKFKLLAESEPGMCARAALNGFKKAVGVGSVAGGLIPQVPQAPLVAGSVTFALASYRSYQKMKTQLAAEKKLEQLNEKMQKTKKMMDVANNVLKLEEFIIKSKPHTEDGYDEHLTQEAKMDAFSLDKLDLARREGPVSKTSVEEIMGEGVAISLKELPSEKLLVEQKPVKVPEQKPALLNLSFFANRSTKLTEKAVLLSKDKGPSTNLNYGTFQ
ncbi:MAG: hypothetical protein ACYCQI_01255 [Gammaproteobacteria bacterium]